MPMIDVGVVQIQAACCVMRLLQVADGIHFCHDATMKQAGKCLSDCYRSKHKPTALLIAVPSNLAARS